MEIVPTSLITNLLPFKKIYKQPILAIIHHTDSLAITPTPLYLSLDY